jgi:hypothetical protein
MVPKTWKREFFSFKKEADSVKIYVTPFHQLPFMTFIGCAQNLGVVHVLIEDFLFHTYAILLYDFV